MMDTTKTAQHGKSLLPDKSEASETVDTSQPEGPAVRPMQKKRFLLGMLLSAGGIGLMLAVAAGALQNFGISGRLSLPAVGLCMIIGLMLLGGGFGVMATAAPGFDDDEFNRLMHAGDVSLPAPLPDLRDRDSSEGLDDTNSQNGSPAEASQTPAAVFESV